jgi:hypothetical protein
MRSDDPGIPGCRSASDVLDGRLPDVRFKPARRVDTAVNAQRHLLTKSLGVDDLAVEIAPVLRGGSRLNNFGLERVLSSTLAECSAVMQ